MSRFTRAIVVTVASLAGLAGGAALTVAATDGDRPRSTTTPEAADGSATTPPSTPAPSTPETLANPPPPPTPVTALTDNVLLVWTSGGLPADLPGIVSRQPSVERSTLVLGDEADLVATHDAAGDPIDELSPGWSIPFDVLAVDPMTFADFAPDARAGRVLAALAPGEGILTETSAALRRLELGSTVSLTTGVVRIVAIIEDASGAGAELIVPTIDAGRLGVDAPRYVLARHGGDRIGVQGAIAEAYRSDRGIRFRSPAETTWLRHGDAVAPLAHVKADFGEFASRYVAGRTIEIDPAFVDEYIVTTEVPILGTVSCHRAVIEPLRAALGSLEVANLGHLVDPADFAGCWSPRRIAAGAPVSRHSWGIAVDLNVAGNPRGSFDTQDDRLVEAMRANGFGWGGTWLVPDPAHYEFLPTP